MAVRPRAVVLGYHDIISEVAPLSGFRNPEAGRYKTSETDFRRHIARLAGTPTVAPSAVSCAREILAGGTFHGLTFDDGGANAVLIADILEERGWRGHFFVVTAQIGCDGFLTARSITELAARGHVVGSHSHSHPAMLARMEPSAVREEWTRSRRLSGGHPRRSRENGVGPGRLYLSNGGGSRCGLRDRSALHLRAHDRNLAPGRLSRCRALPTVRGRYPGNCPGDSSWRQGATVATGRCLELAASRATGVGHKLPAHSPRAAALKAPVCRRRDEAPSRVEACQGPQFCAMRLGHLVRRYAGKNSGSSSEAGAGAAATSAS